MSKKVQYAIGAVGLVPALGLLAQPAVGATAHTSGKRVSAITAGRTRHGETATPAATCIANRYHHVRQNGVSLTVWSAPVGSRICVGTIEVGGDGPIIGTSVLNSFGSGFCARSLFNTFSINVCRHVFRKKGLTIHGWNISERGEEDAYIGL
jgi:hypothetical protein